MRKAYDTILSDYVDADTAAKSGGSEPYRYECAYCWEEVRLCATYSQYQATHFRHRSGNNNVECENYLGNRSAVISNALSCRNVRDKIEFYFSSATKMFSIGVKFSADEIDAYEQSGASFQVRGVAAKPTISIPIKASRFLPDTSELIPISKFSWEYYVSSTNDSTERKYELFRKDGRGVLYPSFFKIQADGDDNSFQAKLVRTETLYTNTTYLIIFTHQYHTLSFQPDVQVVSKVIKFKTMDRDFAGVVVTFINKTARIEQQLKAWKYKLEANETLTLLWPPSPQVDEIIFIGAEYAYIFSSFEIQAHGNINVNSEDIVRLGDGVSKISVSDRMKVYKKNTELLLAKHEDTTNDFDVILVTKETSKKYVAPDNATYQFSSSGVSPMSKGMPVSLTATSEVRHYSFGYLDRIVTAPGKAVSWDGERILRDILMYYKREEAFDWGDYESLDLGFIALQYIESCEKTGRINSAVKYFIEEGRI